MPLQKTSLTLSPISKQFWRLSDLLTKDISYWNGLGRLRPIGEH